MGEEKEEVLCEFCGDVVGEEKEVSDATGFVYCCLDCLVDSEG